MGSPSLTVRPTTHHSATPCVSPELQTKLTIRRLTGSWRRSLGATTPAQSSSTCCSTSCQPTLSSKCEIWTVSGGYSDGGRQLHSLSYQSATAQTEVGK